MFDTFLIYFFLSTVGGKILASPYTLTLYYNIKEVVLANYRQNETYRKATRKAPPPGELPPSNISFSSCLYAAERVTAKIKFMRFPSQSSASTIPFIRRIMRGLTAPPAGEPLLHSFILLLPAYATSQVYTFRLRTLY